MSLANQNPSVKYHFDPSFKATALGGMALWQQAARKLGLYRALAQYVPDPGAQTLAVQLAAGLSLGGHGQAAADLIHQDTQVGRLLGLDRGVGPKRVHPTLVKMAGRSLRTRDKAYKPIGCPRSTRSAGWKRIRTESEPATPEALASIRLVNFALLRRAFALIPKQELKIGDFYCGFLDGSLLETKAVSGDLAAKDRKGNQSVLLMGFWLGPLLLAFDLYPGNTEEGSVALDLIQRGLRAIDDLGIPREQFLLLADSAYGQGHIIPALKDSQVNYILGMNRHRRYLTQKVREFHPGYWKTTSTPARNHRSEEFCLFTYRAQEWHSNVDILAARYLADGELIPQTSFLTSNLTPEHVGKLPASCQGDSLFSSLWLTYARKQQCENFQKDFLSDLGMHHPSSSRTCVNQVLYEIAQLALTIGVFVSRTLLTKPFHNARLWRIARTFYTISACLASHGRTLFLRLSTAPAHFIQAAWTRAMEKLASLR